MAEIIEFGRFFFQEEQILGNANHVNVIEYKGTSVDACTSRVKEAITKDEMRKEQRENNSLKSILLSNQFCSFFVFLFIIMGCNNNQTENDVAQSNQKNTIKIASAMHNVMRKGELAGKIQLDTISNQKGLYGIGPVEFLRGEILISDGKTYVSKMLTDSTMEVLEMPNAKAPFFVYANVTDWNEEKLPAEIQNLKQLEAFVEEKSLNLKTPFVFKLIGKAENTKIHIQNLPEGTKVSSPKEAHQGQVSYSLENENVELVGFFSTKHQGIFTHHDSFIHVHLINQARTKMGHLDEILVGDNELKIYFPK
ncbi:MAG: acetolactate decarboxylase [Flammeovirgaceae bacterium]|jgi:acetolactate decarboxylase